MTHTDWMTLLDPIISALVLGAAGVLTVVLSGIAGRLKAYLDARGEAATSQVVTNAAMLVQQGMKNSAGQIALQVQAGTLDVTNMTQVRAEAVTQARALAGKLPDALAVLKPAIGSVTEGILGHLGSMSAPIVAEAVVPSDAMPNVPSFSPITIPPFTPIKGSST